MKLAYSLLNIKSIDEEQWIIEGIATTPAPDRVDDIVEPKGAQFTLPVPFIYHHYREKPVGSVIEAKVMEEGIWVKIQMVKPTEVESEVLKERLQLAWDEIKTGLIRGLSIGFRAIEYVEISGTWGIRYTKWDWLELSAVTIPANQEATITSVKSLCQEKQNNKTVPQEKSLPCVAPIQVSSTSKHVVVKLTNVKTQGVKL